MLINNQILITNHLRGFTVGWIWLGRITGLSKLAGIQNIIGLIIFFLTIITGCVDGCSAVKIVRTIYNAYLKAETCYTIITILHFHVAKSRKNYRKIRQKFI